MFRIGDLTLPAGLVTALRLAVFFFFFSLSFFSDTFLNREALRFKVANFRR